MTGLIGVLVPELANPIFPALAQAIETRAAPSGLASILCNTTGAAFREVDYVHMLLDRRVQGMIFISCEMTNLRGDHSHYAHLVAEGARIVFVNGAMHTLDVPSVGVDERAAGEIATQHLIELGHERIGFVAGPEHYLPTQLKAAGRLSALAAAGIDADGLISYAEFGIEGGGRALGDLLDRSDPPTGVCSASTAVSAISSIGCSTVVSAGTSTWPRRSRRSRRRRGRPAPAGRGAAASCSTPIAIRSFEQITPVGGSRLHRGARAAPAAALDREVRVRDEPVGVEPARAQRAAPAGGLLLRRQVVLGPGDEADALVPELEQVLRRELAGGALVDADRRDVERVRRAVDEDDPRALVDELRVVARARRACSSSRRR